MNNICCGFGTANNLRQSNTSTGTQIALQWLLYHVSLIPWKHVERWTLIKSVKHTIQYRSWIYEQRKCFRKTWIIYSRALLKMLSGRTENVKYRTAKLRSIIRRWLQRADSSDPDSFHFGENTAEGPVETKNAFGRNIYLSFNWNGEICGRQWRISSSNINPLRLIGARLFSAPGAGRSRYLWNIDTRRTRPPTIIEAFPQGSELKKKKEEKYRKRRVEAERINGCLETSRRSRLRRTRRGWIIARLIDTRPVIFRFIHTLHENSVWFIFSFGGAQIGP